MDPSTYEFVAPEGVFSLLAHIDNSTYVFRDGLVNNGYFSLFVNSEEADKYIITQGVDEHGQPFDAVSSNVTAFRSIGTMPPDTSALYGYLSSGNRDTLFVSSFNENTAVITADMRDDIATSGTIHFIEYPPVVGLEASQVLTNTKNDFVEQDIEIIFPPGSASKSIIPYASFRFKTINVGAFGSGLPREIVSHSSSKWPGKLWLASREEANTSAALLLAANSDPELPPWVASRPLRVIDKKVALYNVDLTPDIHIFEPDSKIILGTAPAYPSFYRKFQFFPGLFVDPLFQGSLGEVRWQDWYFTAYRITDENDRVIEEGTLPEFRGIDSGMSPFTFQAVNTGYFVAEQRGRGTFRVHVASRGEEGLPPQLTSLKLLDSNASPTWRLSSGEQAVMQFSVIRRGADGQPLLHLRQHGQEEWRAVETAFVVDHPEVGDLFSAELSAFTQVDSTAMDLKIAVTNDTGAWIEWIMEPAFAIGDFTPVTAIEPPVPVVKEFVLNNNYPNPFNPETVISYTLSQKSHVKLEIFNLRGQLVRTLVNKELLAGDHKDVWDGKNEAGITLSSGLYFYKINAGKHEEVRRMMLLR